jgi:hypothetical protein
VDELLMNYFTYRALRETLAQMQETDLSPGKGEYKWLYNFAASEYQNRGNEFVAKLFAEGRSDHAQRILAQRVVLLKRWNGYYVRGRGNERCYSKYEEKNLSLLREHLLCTINLSDDALVDVDGRESNSTDCSLYESIIKNSEDDASSA